MMKKIIYLLLIGIFIIPINVYAGRGCCSWHGGQSYCSGGHWICSDGWQSSCSCYSGGRLNSYSSSNYNSNSDDDDNNSAFWIAFFSGGATIGALTYFLLYNKNKKR